MKKVTITIVLIFLLTGCLELSGCGGGLSAIDKQVITLNAIDVAELSERAQVMDCNDPATCVFLKGAMKEASRACTLAMHAVNGTDPNE